MPRYPTDPDTLLSICEVRFVRGSGPGGQHRNKTETGVQMTHPPTGIVVSATERRSVTQVSCCAWRLRQSWWPSMPLPPRISSLKAGPPFCGAPGRRAHPLRRGG